MNFWSHRRTLLDTEFENIKRYMNGLVLDIGGGMEGGQFKRPDDVEWIVLDVNRELLPSIVADAQKLPVKSGIVDFVKRVRVLEHIEEPEKSIKERLTVPRLRVFNANNRYFYFYKYLNTGDMND